MSTCNLISKFCGLGIVILLATAAWSDTMAGVTSKAALSPNDSVKWSQLGANGKVLTSAFSAKSVSGITVSGTLTGPNSLTSAVCAASPCSWRGTGIPAADIVIWTSDAANGGNGPITLSFGTSISGAGALIQADTPGQFTAQIQAFNGSTLLGSFSVTSNANGDATYIGILDKTAANITSITLNLTACSGTCTDFALDTVDLLIPTTTTFVLSVTTAGTGSGTVTSSPAGINCPGTCTANFASGTSVTLTATAASGSTFAGWSGACSGTGTCTVTMNAAKSVTATFNVVASSYTLTVTKGGTGKGTVTSSPAGINCGTTCSASYAAGTVVTLTATPAVGSFFGGWSGACTGTAKTCSVTMNAAKSVKAIFKPITYKLTVTKGGTGAGTVTSSPSGISCGTTCSHLFNSGTVVKLTATPFSGHTFTGWSGACTGTGTCSVTMTAPKSVTATFN